MFAEQDQAGQDQSALIYKLFHLQQEQVKNYVYFHIKQKVSMVTMFDSNINYLEWVF